MEAKCATVIGWNGYPNGSARRLTIVEWTVAILLGLVSTGSIASAPSLMRAPAICLLGSRAAFCLCGMQPAPSDHHGTRDTASVHDGGRSWAPQESIEEAAAPASSS